MEEIHYTFRMLTLSQVLLLCLCTIYYHRSMTGFLVALNCMGFACYLIMPFTQKLLGSGLLYSVGIIITNSIPAFLWLLAKRFFEDDTKIPIGFWLIWLVYMALWIPDWSSKDVIQNPAMSDFLFDLLPQAIKLGLVLHVVYIALEGREYDLVNRRLKLRVPIALGASVVASIVILIEIWVSGPMPMLIEAVGSVCLFLFALLGNIYLFRFRKDLSLAPIKSDIPSNIDNNKANPVEIAAIKKAMGDDRFYANHGATIGDLADLLATPAYRLRTIINQQLLFRNFNQFLNQYRIDEATRRLSSERELPILSIALDVGFNSLSSFNKAFRDIHGKTPSEYRADLKSN